MGKKKNYALLAVKNALAWLDWLLDQIPAREDGRWVAHGEWGCRIRYRFPGSLNWIYED